MESKYCKVSAQIASVAAHKHHVIYVPAHNKRIVEFNVLALKFLIYDIGWSCRQIWAVGFTFCIPLSF